MEFLGIVRGCHASPFSGMGAVIVEVGPATKVPPHPNVGIERNLVVKGRMVPVPIAALVYGDYEKCRQMASEMGGKEVSVSWTLAKTPATSVTSLGKPQIKLL